MSRGRMVYERGRLVPEDHSERLAESRRRIAFAQGTGFGLVVGAGVVMLGFTVGMAWAVIGILAAAVFVALKDGGGGDTVGKAGNSVPGGHG